MYTNCNFGKQPIPILETKLLMLRNNTPKVFLDYLHSFRGLSIILIVLLHSIYASFFMIGFDDSNSYLAITTQVLLHGGTIFFAIISGLLFSNILKKRGYKNFYISKVKYVIFPYMLFTIVLTFFVFNYNVFNSGNYTEFIWAYLNLVLENLIYGKVHYIYWYIPVLIFLYLVTPLLYFLQKTNAFTKILFGIIIISPLFISRTEMSFQTMVYFTGCYAFGMYIGDGLQMKLAYISKYKTLIISVVVLSTIVLFYLFLYEVNKLGMVYLRESFFYIQKTALALLIIWLFKELNKQPKWLGFVARDSFSIYFLHAPILAIFGILLSKMVYNLHLNPFYMIILGFLICFITIVISMLIVYVFRRVFGKKSRMLIGSK